MLCEINNAFMPFENSTDAKKLVNEDQGARESILLIASSSHGSPSDGASDAGGDEFNFTAI